MTAITCTLIYRRPHRAIAAIISRAGMEIDVVSTFVEIGASPVSGLKGVTESIALIE